MSEKTLERLRHHLNEWAQDLNLLLCEKKAFYMNVFKKEKLLLFDGIRIIHFMRELY